MKVTLNELRNLIKSMVNEAKKKKEKDKKPEVKPEGYSRAESFDFSKPLGGNNLYRSQGAVNWGPGTGLGPVHEEALRQFVRGVLDENIAKDPWLFLSEVVEPGQNDGIWESAMHWYDFQGLGLGSQTSAGLAEKKEKMAKKAKKKKA